MRIGIDLGGTKIELRALHSDNGKELYKQRIPTPKTYDEALTALVTMVKTCEETLGETGTVGMGIPGSIDRQTGLVKNSYNTPLHGKPLVADLSKTLNRDVRVANDANCLALSEAMDGAGAGHNVVFTVILGTGVGGGIVVNQKLLEGPNRIAGEYGHLPLPWITEDERTTETCYCGACCIEHYCSGTGLKRDYAHVTGEALSTHDIVAKATQGESKAAAAMERFCHRLARSLAVVINFLDPDVIVLGGGMSNVPLLYQRVPELWQEFVSQGKYIFSPTVVTPLKPALHGDASGVRGAAWLGTIGTKNH